MESQEFGPRLKELRRQAGLSQRELADKVGIHFTYLSKIESGAMPPPSKKVILRLAEALNVDQDELIVWAGKIPADIAQILKSRETLQFLRSRRPQQKARSSNKIHIMKYLRRYKSLSRVAIPIVLVITVTASLLLSSPLPVKAFNLSLSVEDSPITSPTNGVPTYLLGENVTIPASIVFSEEVRVIEKVELKVRGPQEVPGVTPRIWELPTEKGVFTGITGNLAGYILDYVNVSWADMFYGGYGYGYGYGYLGAGAGGGTIDYVVQWTPPLTVSVAQPPATPTGLAIEVVPAGRALQLSWNANTEADVAGYNLYTSTDDITYTLRTAVMAPNTAYTDTGLINGQVYYYQLAAFNTANYESNRSSPISETPRDKTAPATPTGLAVQAAAAGSSLIISWNANTETDLAGYNLYASTDDVNYILETTISSSNTSYTHSGLADGQTYYYKLSAIDGVPNESAVTAVVSNLPVDTAAPATPIGLATQAVAAGNSLIISWNANTATDLAGYKLWISTDNITYSLEATLGKVTTYTDTVLTNGTKYYYKLSAFDEVPNESSRTTAVSGTPADTVKPVTPTGLAIQVVATGSALKLSWTANTEADLDYYNLYFSGTGLPDSYSVKRTLAKSLTSYTDNISLTNGNKYFYKLSAVDDDNNESNPTALVSATPADTLAPAVPSGLSATAGTANVTLSWTANTETDLDGYNLYRSTSFGGTYSKLTTSPSPWPYTSGINTSLTNGTTYYYKVTAVDAAGNESAKSPIVSATPTPIPTSAGERDMPPSALSTLNLAYEVPTMSSAIATASGITKVEVSNTPLGLASDGTNLYILVDGVSSADKDVILVVNPATGVVSNAFYAASSNATNDITYHDSNLWLALNPGGDNNNSIVEVSKTDGSLTGRSTGVLKDKDIYGLTSDGSYIYAAEYPNPSESWWGSDKNVWKVNPVAGTKTTLLTKFGWGKGFSAVASNSKGLIGVDLRENDSDLYLWSIEDGSDINSYYINKKIEGMTFIGNTLFLAARGTTNNIYVSQPEKPERPDWPWVNAYKDRVDLTWNWWGWPASKLRGYNVYRSTTSSSGPYYQIASLVTDKNYSDYSVNMNTDYWYKVTAVSIFGIDSTMSDSVKATTPKMPAPNNIWTQGGIGQVVITWEAPMDIVASQIQGYNIYRKKGWAGTWGITPINSTPVTVLTYTDSGLDGDTEYYYKIRVIDLNNIEGEPTWESWSWVNSMPAPWLDQVQPSYGQVYLKWKHDYPDLVKSYKVYRRLGWTGAFELIATVVTGTSYTDTTVVGGNDYFYKVSAVDFGDKETQASGDWSAFVPQMGAPENFYLSLTGEGYISLSWGLPWGITASQIKGYNVYRAIGSLGPYPPPTWPSAYTKIASLVTTKYYTDTAPQSGANWYRVTAVDMANIESQPSPDQNWGIEPVKPPWNVWGNIGMLGEAYLQWDTSPSPNVIGYNVYRSTMGSAGPWTKIATKVPAVNYTDYDAAGGATWWVVRSVDVKGSESSNSPAFYLLLPPPAEPPAPPGPKVIPPQLAAGTYTAQLTVYYDGGKTKSSATVTFKLKAIDQVSIEITELETAGGETIPITRVVEPNFAATTPNIVVKGVVNDPSIENVNLGVVVPWTELFSDGMEDPATATTKWSHLKPPPEALEGWEWVQWYGTDLWRRISVDNYPGLRTHSGKAAWYYGIPQQKNYETWNEQRTMQLGNTGILMATPFTVGEDAELSFWTWYETDPGVTFDMKAVLLKVEGEANPRFLAQISDFTPPSSTGYVPPPLPGSEARIVSPPFGMGFEWINWKVAAMPMKQWREVKLDLNEFAGKTVQLMFFFNTGEASGNQYEGWYIDDVSISGKGTVGQSYPVTDMTFEIPFTLGEGDNAITVKAASPYKSYLQPTTKGLDEDSITGIMDTMAPYAALEPVPASTKLAAYTVKGAVSDLNFDSLDLQVKYGGEDTYKTVLTLRTMPAQGKFESLITLTEGQNYIRVIARDKAGFTNATLNADGNVVDVPAAAKATIYLDIVPPDVVVLDTIYPIGNISARPEDEFVWSIKTADSFSGKNLTVWTTVTPSGGASYNSYWKKVSEWPEAVRDSFGVSAEADFVFITKLPAAPPGTFTMTVNVMDQAGNTRVATLSAKVVSALEAFNSYLMPNWNLVSLPLIHKDADANNYVPVSKVIADVPGIQSIWYYDAATQTWKFYLLGPEGLKPTPTLTKMRPGEGYWINMVPSTDQMEEVNGVKGYYVLDTSGNQIFVTKGYWMYNSAQGREVFVNQEAFKYSAPLPGLTAATPAAIKLTIKGFLLKPGFAVPPSYPVASGWNLIGFHSEREKAVNVGLRSLTYPPIWASIIAYDNYIAFLEGKAEIYLGAFWSLTESDKLKPGKGYWLWASQSGTIVP